MNQKREASEDQFSKSVPSEDDVYRVSSGEECEEDESTIEEEELIEGDACHEEEIKALEEEGKVICPHIRMYASSIMSLKLLVLHAWFLDEYVYSSKMLWCKVNFLKLFRLLFWISTV